MNAQSVSALCDQIRSLPDFPHTVDRLPLLGPDNTRTPWYGLFRSDNGKPVGQPVTSRYVPHNVDDMCALFEGAAAAFGTDGCTVTGNFFGDSHNLIVAPSREHRLSIFGTDTIWPRFVIRAGYNGECFSASLGWYRDACRNLAIVRSAGRSANAKIKHTHSLRDRLADLRETFARLADNWDREVNAARTLADKSVPLADFLAQLYPIPENATQRQINAARDRAAAIYQRIGRERMQILGLSSLGANWANAVTAWEAYNGVQAYVQHNSRRKGRLDPLQRALLSLDSDEVDRAWDLATTMAAAA